MKKILFITAYHTGYGHKSISDSIQEYLRLNEEIELKEIDGFDLMGTSGQFGASLYAPMVRYAPAVWKFYWDASDRFGKLTTSVICLNGYRRFKKLLDTYEPDLIVSVHSAFNGTIDTMLKKYGKKIPFIVIQADIINMHSFWCDNRTDITICPTKEAYDVSVSKGMDERKLRLMGFPTRKSFTDAAKENPTPDYDGTRPLRCLMVSGSDGAKMAKSVKAILRGSDVDLTVVCGRNRKIYDYLTEKYVPTYGDRLKVLGFTKEMEKVMLQNDVMIARGSPNTLYEAIVMNLPVILTSAVPGQESDNPRLMVSHNLGIICRQTEKIPEAIETLMADGMKKYKEIRASQREYRNLDNAKIIADFLAEQVLEKQ